MPDLPFVLYGVVYELNGSTPSNGALVTVKNTTRSSSLSIRTDSLGAYAVDLQNLLTSYQVGDVLSIKANIGNRIKVASLTITSGMITAGGTQQNLTLLGIRQHTYFTLEDLYDDNMPPSFTDELGTSRSWTVVSAFPESNPTFPLIVISPAQITSRFISLDNSQQDDEINVETEFFTKAEWKKGIMDKARDHTEYVLKSNESTLNYAGLFFSEQPIDDSNVGNLIFDNVKYNIASQILHFRWNP